jgi:hypothetical protein
MKMGRDSRATPSEPLALLVGGMLFAVPASVAINVPAFERMRYLRPSAANNAFNLIFTIELSPRTACSPSCCRLLPQESLSVALCLL